jgi:hypothetical protein
MVRLWTKQNNLILGHRSRSFVVLRDLPTNVIVCLVCVGKRCLRGAAGQSEDVSNTVIMGVYLPRSVCLSLQGPVVAVGGTC